MAVIGYAHLEPPALKAVQDLEKKYELVLLAFQKPSATAELTQDQIIQIQQLERKLGCRLIAYE
ncbi:MAG: hypothetical protein LUO93_00375 [Methanomicrobiales archaeon]|nr:hypothetical protein [Methanomicrobiales archaeon]